VFGFSRSAGLKSHTARSPVNGATTGGEIVYGALSCALPVLKDGPKPLRGKPRERGSKTTVGGEFPSPLGRYCPTAWWETGFC
jgi:hypothetical protein